MKILMVCLGNICRSPLAEAILREKAKRAGLQWEVESAGTNGYHTGEAPHHLSIKVASLNGIDISTQVSRRFTQQDLEQYDLIYAMAPDVVDEMKRIAGNSWNRQKIKLLLDELHPGENKEVPDPWYGGEEGYHEVYALLDQACEALINKAIQNNPGLHSTI